MSIVSSTNEILAGRLEESFAIGENADGEITLKDQLEQAQQNYEFAKANEIRAAIELDFIKFTDDSEFEAAVTRVIASVPTKPDGTSTLARTPAEKLAKIEPGYLKYLRRLQDAVDDKRTAEKWHSIAYQRLETIREVYKKA